LLVGELMLGLARGWSPGSTGGSSSANNTGAFALMAVFAVLGGLEDFLTAGFLLFGFGATDLAGFLAFAAGFFAFAVLLTLPAGFLAFAAFGFLAFADFGFFDFATGDAFQLRLGIVL
jgi:hypothetical protein